MSKANLVHTTLPMRKQHLTIQLSNSILYYLIIMYFY